MGFIQDGKWRSDWYCPRLALGAFLGHAFQSLWRDLDYYNVWIYESMKNLNLENDFKDSSSCIHPILFFFPSDVSLFSNSLHVAQPDWAASTRHGSSRRSPTEHFSCDRYLCHRSGSCRTSVLYEISSARCTSTCRRLDNRTCLGMWSLQKKKQEGGICFWQICIVVCDRRFRFGCDWYLYILSRRKAISILTLW